MKTFVLALLIFAGLFAAVPQAEARHRDCYDGYYRRPVYSYRYARPYYYPVRTYSYYRPAYYYRPVRYYYNDYGYCAPRVRYYSSRPRLSFFFGF
jgi:hypothetical protein